MQASESSIDRRRWWRSSDPLSRETTDEGFSFPSPSLPPMTPEGPRCFKAPPLPTTPERGLAPWVQRSPFENLADPEPVYEEKVLYPQEMEVTSSNGSS